MAFELRQVTSDSSNPKSSTPLYIPTIDFYIVHKASFLNCVLKDDRNALELIFVFFWGQVFFKVEKKTPAFTWVFLHLSSFLPGGNRVITSQRQGPDSGAVLVLKIALISLKLWGQTIRPFETNTSMHMLNVEILKPLSFLRLSDHAWVTT